MENPPRKNASPADYLANERTYLAWIRTGISVMAFGFVVVKFSLFVKQLGLMMGEKATISEYSASRLIGIGLVALGTLICVTSFFRYRQTEQKLNNKEYKSSTFTALLLLFSIVIVGVILVIYLFTDV